MSVAKVVEILAEGDSIEDATQEAVREASKTIDNIENVYVDNFRGIVNNGTVERYRIRAKVSFVVQEGGKKRKNQKETAKAHG